MKTFLEWIIFTCHLIFRVQNLFYLLLCLKVILINMECSSVTWVIDVTCAGRNCVTFLLLVWFWIIFFFFIKTKGCIGHIFTYYFVLQRHFFFSLVFEILWLIITTQNIVSLSLISALLIQGPELDLVRLVQFFLLTCIQNFYGAKDVTCTLSRIGTRLF